MYKQILTIQKIEDPKFPTTHFWGKTWVFLKVCGSSSYLQLCELFPANLAFTMIPVSKLRSHILAIYHRYSSLMRNEMRSFLSCSHGLLDYLQEKLMLLAQIMKTCLRKPFTHPYLVFIIFRRYWPNDSWASNHRRSRQNDVRNPQPLGNEAKT